jgi:hypothetical protein
MGNVESVPGCFGYYPQAVFTNNCQNCGWVELCKRVVAKDRLTPVLDVVRQAKAIVKGESRWEK